MLPRNTVRRLPAGSGRGAAANLRAHPVRVSARSYDRPGGGRRGPGAAPGRAGGIAGARGARDGGRLVVAAARRRRDHLVRRPLPRGPDAGDCADRAQPAARRAAAAPRAPAPPVPAALAGRADRARARARVLAGIGYLVARRVQGQSGRLSDQASGILGDLRARQAPLPGIGAGLSSCCVVSIFGLWQQSIASWGARHLPRGGDRGCREAMRSGGYARAGTSAGSSRRGPAARCPSLLCPSLSRRCSSRTTGEVSSVTIPATSSTSPTAVPVSPSADVR